MTAHAGPSPEFSVFGWAKGKISGGGDSSYSGSSSNRAPVRSLPSQNARPQAEPQGYQAVRAPQNPYLENRPTQNAASASANGRSLWGPQQNPQIQPQVAARRPMPTVAPQMARPPASRTSAPQVAELRARAHAIADRKYKYVFGGELPSEGGLDCSGTVQFLLKSMGMRNVPRTSYLQFDWLKDAGTLNTVGMFHSPERAWKNLQPGDLVFWGKTWNSGHKVSHVMIYLGQSPSGKKYMFGARGSGKTGLTGAEVDVYELNSSRAATMVGYGRIPGLRR